LLAALMPVTLMTLMFTCLSAPAAAADSVSVSSANRLSTMTVKPPYATH